METAPSPKAQSAPPPPDSAPWRGVVWRSREKRGPTPSSSSRPSLEPRASQGRTSTRRWRPFLPMGLRCSTVLPPRPPQLDHPLEAGLHLPCQYRVNEASLRTLTGMGANPSREGDLGSRSMARGNPDSPPANRPSVGALLRIGQSLEKTTASQGTTFWKGPSYLQRSPR